MDLQQVNPSMHAQEELDEDAMLEMERLEVCIR